MRNELLERFDKGREEHGYNALEDIDLVKEMNEEMMDLLIYKMMKDIKE